MQETAPRLMFYKLAKEVCHKDGIDELTEKEKHQVAQRLLYMCFQHCVSTRKRLPTGTVILIGMAFGNSPSMSVTYAR